VPNLLGQWVLCVEVKEWRNGQLLSVHYRDFQYNVINCNLTVTSGFESPAEKCIGTTLSFTNQSFSNFGMNYHWDFGESTLSNDTSNIKNPTYTFSDTGSFYVKLVINPGLPCSDSITKLVSVYPPFNPAYIKPGNFICLKDSVFNFSIGGNYVAGAATFTSYFGANATPSISSLTSSQIKFSSPGYHVLKHYGQQHVCYDTLIDSIYLVGKPLADILNLPFSACSPATIKFKSTASYSIQNKYVWQIGNVYTYGYEPTQTFVTPGNYTANLSVIRTGNCPDTATSEIKTFTVFPKRNASFKMEPEETTILDPEVYFENLSTGDIDHIRYNFGDGTYSFYMNEKHLFYNPGTYNIKQIVTNSHQCSDTAYKVLIVNPEVRIWVPNAFTPTEDGLNDLFMPMAIGTKDFLFQVFSRNGQKLFTTTNIGDGWDGTFKGKLCKEDVYVWKISYTSSVSEKFITKTGTVMLMNRQ
ncbi:MAG: PKD domain-containing protein, partial [Bacteroidia bacterium]